MSRFFTDIQLRKYKELDEKTKKEIARQTALAQLKAVPHIYENIELQEKIATETARRLIDTVI